LLEGPESLVIYALRPAVNVEKAGTAVEDERPNVAALDHCAQVVSVALEV
jgi:hypothetical protein